MTAAPLLGPGPMPSEIVVPDLPTGASAEQAALAYAAGGIHVGPLAQGTKHPGSRLGDSWVTQTSTDPKTIYSWFAGTDDGVFIHALGLLIFDVDRPAAVPDWLWPHLATAPFQRTRRDGDIRKGHYLFAAPAGRQLGNSLGKLERGWGEIRGCGGVIVAAPTRHEAVDGLYAWVRTGVVPVLPEVIAEKLPEAGPGERVATTAEVAAFLTANTDAAKPWLVDVICRSFATKTAAGGSRHEEAVAAACWIARESAAGLFSARIAFQQLFDAFEALIGTDRPAKAEFKRIVGWSIGQLTPERIAEVRLKHFGPPLAEVLQMPAPKTAPAASPTIDGTSAMTMPPAPWDAPTPTDPTMAGEAVVGDTEPPADPLALAVDQETCRQLIQRRARRKADEIEAAEAAAGQDYADRYLDVEELHLLPTPEPLIDGILAHHTYVVMRGRDASFKSFVALDWALCLATGEPWLGRPVQQTRVMWLAGEGAYGTRARVLAWEQSRGVKVPAGTFTMRAGAVNFFRGGPELEDFVARVAEGGYGFVVLDTLRRISGGADGNGSDMGQVIDNVVRVRQAASDGTVLAVAHTDKGDNDTRGASSIEDDADGVWHAKRDEDGGAALALKCVKAKDAADGLALDLRMRVVELKGLARSDGRPETSLVIERAASMTRVTAPETVNQQKVLMAIREAAATGLTEKSMSEFLGLVKSSVNRAVNSLAKSGLIVKRGQFWYPAAPVVEASADRSQAS